MGKRFIIYGLIGLCMEVFWVAFWGLVRGDINMIGTTSLWMLPIYGLGIFFEPLHDNIRHMPAILRGGVYTLLIFSIEFISGWIFKNFIGVLPWDYSGSPFSVYGLIRLDYAPAWFAVGLLFEKLHDKLKKIEFVRD